ncbi:unnamed protein product, partial [Rotaria magnacalcarata]
MPTYEYIRRHRSLQVFALACLTICTTIVATFFSSIGLWKKTHVTITRPIKDKYIASIPYGRLSNRYFQIKTMVRLAYYLNRTLVLIPYEGVEVDELFDLGAINKEFHRSHLTITWKEYQRRKNISSCLCLKSAYCANSSDTFPMCTSLTKNGSCKLIRSHPILGEQRVELQSIDAASAIQDSFMIVSGRWVWELDTIKGFPKILVAQKNKTSNFHLKYLKSIWAESQHIYRWLVSRSNSSANTTLAIHIRRGDLSSRLNLTTFLETAKKASLEYSVPQAHIFIATDANAAELQIIRRTFTLAVIECPEHVSEGCKHH